jgi:y4mF family transcriptional regulator
MGFPANGKKQPQQKLRKSMSKTKQKAQNAPLPREGGAGGGSPIQAISEEIRRRRRLLKITQEDLAELSGVSTRYIHDIEKGIANPSLATLLTILQILGLELSVRIRQPKTEG